MTVGKMESRPQSNHEGNLIICCSDISDPDWRWIERNFEREAFRFEFINSSPQNWLERHVTVLNSGRLRACFQAVLKAKREKALLLVTHGPSLAAWCGVFGLIFRLETRLLAHSFNFASLPGRLKAAIFGIGIKKADRVVTFSNIERDIYSRAFGIDKARFDFVHWGANEPRAAGRAVGSDYVSSIGGNERDYATLMESARQLPHIPFVIVGRPENFLGLSIPKNVTVQVNTPLDYAMSVLKYSRFTVLPLNSSEVPCGHVTIVAAMHLGRAVVITASSGVDDYVAEERTALLYPAKDASALSDSISRLWADSDLANRLGESGRAFALTNCTEENIAQHFRRYAEMIFGASKSAHGSN